MFLKLSTRKIFRFSKILNIKLFLQGKITFIKLNNSTYLKSQIILNYLIRLYK